MPEKTFRNDETGSGEESVGFERLAAFAKYLTRECELGQTTVAAYVVYIRRSEKKLREGDSSKFLLNLGNAEVEALLNEMSEVFSATTVGGMQSALRLFFLFATSKHWIKCNPFSNTTRRIDQLPRVFHLEDFKALCELSGNGENATRDCAIFQLMAHGLTSAEIAAANMRHFVVVPDARRLSARIHVPGNVVARDVPLDRRAHIALCRYLKIPNNQAYSAKSRDSENPLFVDKRNSADDRRITTKQVVSVGTNFLAELDFAGRRPRVSALRHTFAWLLAKRGSNVEEVEERLGLGDRCGARYKTLAKKIARDPTGRFYERKAT